MEQASGAIRSERQLLHDVNAALQLVVGNLELLDLMAGLDAERKALIDDAMAGAADATRLVRELQQRLRLGPSGAG
jgi:hypothetical protein